MNAFYTHSVCYFVSHIAEFLLISPDGGGTSLFQLNQGGCWPIATNPAKSFYQQRGKVLANQCDCPPYKLGYPNYL